MSSKSATRRTEELLKKHADFKMSAWDSLMEYRNLCFQMEHELAEARKNNEFLSFCYQVKLEKIKQAERRVAEAEKDAKRYSYKLADIKACFRGIDAQAIRITAPPSTDWKDQKKEIIIGYQLNTGLWHRVMGLLADVDAALLSTTLKTGAQSEKEKR